MKKMLFVATVLSCTFASCSTQTKTPDAVEAAFNQKFPNASKVKWGKENPHEYEAEFEWKGEKHSANFNDSGDWLETESPISFTQLPDDVTTAFNASHKKAKIKVVAKIETSNGITKFEIEFKNEVKTQEVFYTTEGKEIKK